MHPVQDVRRRLMEFFAYTAQRGRVYGPREFNSQVMMNTYAADDRAALTAALEELVTAGVLQESSATEFCLTEAGLSLARGMREATQVAGRRGIAVS